MIDKKVIGVKSYKFILLETIGFVVGLILTILFLYDYSRTSREICLLFGIVTLVSVIFVAYLLIKFLIKPKNTVEVDGKGVYLNFSKKKVIYILFRDIDNVYGDKISAWNANYEFGILYIFVKNKRYKIGVINDIKETEKYIYSKIVWKFKN